ncbi:hypothetical protein TRFO_39513 [Tritrichomonas foetus]|uniref:Kelch motif family protein n=1 Tax=Tritrichomonas foetus TaxID=1144522 RepID=A0A1J4J6J0_9EUKA|nr:hypothetical protein TRFO_39513 [Tritrichomonas foetus]|eukprot:OHS94281.1 hypothetical protein TRFO_39513 [Tritrichomonas foetus]
MEYHDEDNTIFKCNVLTVHKPSDINSVINNSLIIQSGNDYLSIISHDLLLLTLTPGQLQKANNSISWNKITNAPFKYLSGMSVTAFPEGFYFFGGENSQNRKLKNSPISNKMYIYRLHEWHSVFHTLEARSFHSFCFLNEIDSLCIFGGQTKTGISSDFIIFNTITTNWYKVELNINIYLKNHSMIDLNNGKIVVIGGENQNNELNQLIYLIDYKTGDVEIISEFCPFTITFPNHISLIKNEAFDFIENNQNLEKEKNNLILFSNGPPNFDSWIFNFRYRIWFRLFNKESLMFPIDDGFLGFSPNLEIAYLIKYFDLQIFISFLLKKNLKSNLYKQNDFDLNDNKNIDSTDKDFNFLQKSNQTIKTTEKKINHSIFKNTQIGSIDEDTMDELVKNIHEVKIKIKETKDEISKQNFDENHKFIGNFNNYLVLNSNSNLTLNLSNDISETLRKKSKLLTESFNKNIELKNSLELEKKNTFLFQKSAIPMYKQLNESINKLFVSRSERNDIIKKYTDMQIKLNNEFKNINASNDCEQVNSNVEAYLNKLSILSDIKSLNLSKNKLDRLNLSVEKDLDAQFILNELEILTLNIKKLDSDQKSNDINTINRKITDIHDKMNFFTNRYTKLRKVFDEIINSTTNIHKLSTNRLQPLVTINNCLYDDLLKYSLE